MCAKYFQDSYWMVAGAIQLVDANNDETATPLTNCSLFTSSWNSKRQYGRCFTFAPASVLVTSLCDAAAQLPMKRDDVKLCSNTFINMRNHLPKVVTISTAATIEKSLTASGPPVVEVSRYSGSAATYFFRLSALNSFRLAGSFTRTECPVTGSNHMMVVISW